MRFLAKNGRKSIIQILLSIHKNRNPWKRKEVIFSQGLHKEKG
jgi:hypothetical protein